MINQVMSEDVKPGMILYVEGYLFEVLESKAYPSDYPAKEGSFRQVSKVKWSEIGDEPPNFYKEINIGLKHGLEYTQYIP